MGKCCLAGLGLLLEEQDLIPGDAMGAQCRASTSLCLEVAVVYSP